MEWSDWKRWERAARLGAALMLALGASEAVAQALPTISQPAPAAAPKARAVVDLASALAQTAAVVEATVQELRSEYRDAEGPWTRVVLSDVQVHLGALPGPAAKRLELWQFGGALPNGRLVVAAELPVFTKGKRYLLFLRNTEWNVSPVVGPWALRVESAGPLGKEALFTSDGQVVLGADERGLSLGPSLYEPAPFDGSAAPPRAAASPAASPAALPDRGALLAALKAAMAEQKLQASGAFLERPAGRFKWRAQATTPHGQANPATAAGRDLSGGAR